MMRLGTFAKSPQERKRYTIDYTDWLETAETITAALYTIRQATSPALVVDAQSILTGNKKVSFYVSGGDDTETYDVEVKITTSTGQIKEDVVSFTVKEV